MRSFIRKVTFEDVFEGNVSFLSMWDDTGGAENMSESDRGPRQSGQHGFTCLRVFKMHCLQKM